MELPDLDTAKALGQFGLLAILWLRFEVRLSRLEALFADHLSRTRAKTLVPLLAAATCLTASGCRTQWPQSGQALITYPPGSVLIVWTNSTWPAPGNPVRSIIVSPAPN